MKVYHDTSVDYPPMDFTYEDEAKSVYKVGIIVRYYKKGNVIGVDITDSMKLFAYSALMTLQEVCEFLYILESTMRRYIKAGEVNYSMEGKDYRFKKDDILKLDAYFIHLLF